MIEWLLPLLLSGDVDWGDMPAWVSALFAAASAAVSTLALVFAAVAARAAQSVYHIESRRDRLAEEERRERHEESLSAQASRVTAWTESQKRNVNLSGQRVERFWIKVKNLHDLPIYNLSIHYCFPDAGEYKVVKSYAFPTVPPGETVQVDPKTTLLLRVGVDAFKLGRVAVLFDDSAGLSWWRGVDGRLMRNRNADIPLPESPLKDVKIYAHFQGQREEYQED
ncbi:hypothetical protein ACVMYR_26765 [Micromonospora sp. PTRAS2]